jgi:preprotein translocase subunit SecG
MQTVLIVVHLMIVVALIGVVLLQRSEGGGLGIGGGSGFMTARGAANALTRATAILATLFFATSLLLSIMARYGEKPTDILDRVPAQTEGGAGGVLNQLGGQGTQAPSAGEAAPAIPAAESGTTTTPAAGSATPPAAGTTTPAAPAQGGAQVPNSQ